MNAHTVAFRAMGTDVSLVGPAGSGSFHGAHLAVRAMFEREERRCSRFRADSELSRVNANAGTWTTVSEGFAGVVAFALDAARRTDGRFDPTVLEAVVAAGYDRDFDEMLAGARARLRLPVRCGRWDEVELRDRQLRLPAGVGLDLGGVAKGWTVDVAAGEAVEAGLPWALVNAGGDLRLCGCPPEGGIEIGIEDPEDPSAELGRLRLVRGALATSSVTRRAWGPDLHHLIDPRSARPADGRVLQATVWAPTCAEAEVAAKDVLLSGEAALDRSAGVVVLRDGEVHSSLEAA
ncbi:MAG TPA: FAD:protein FMN transferase [Actinomycetota bacterium]|nr:FAD:protein FMN transferase [Actinomycetota bacterium]